MTSNREDLRLRALECVNRLVAPAPPRRLARCRALRGSVTVKIERDVDSRRGARAVGRNQTDAGARLVQPRDDVALLVALLDVLDNA